MMWADIVSFCGTTHAVSHGNISSRQGWRWLCVHFVCLSVCLSVC